jgi:ectoine hydroxylase-related dioxygenase (phytanoyl-CoA dioxygenase family)
LTHAPTVVTVLIYLDTADDQTGPLFVIPGSHHRPQQPTATSGNLPAQVTLSPVPGQLVLMNAAAWHRGGPNLSPSQVRRLITLQLSSVLMAPFNFEPAQPSPAYQQLVTQAANGRDEPLLELLGLGGVNPASARY